MDATVKSSLPLRALLLGLALVAVCAAPAGAVPSLQLGIVDGAYDRTTETTVSTADAFTLSALLTLSQGNTLGDYYYVSAAITPQVPLTTPSPDLGFFTWNGVRQNVTSDMTFGTPPVDEILLSGGATNPADPGDLPSHGIYPTYFSQFKFQFDPSLNTPIAYNTNPYDSDGANPNQTQYFETFNVDVSGLKAGYALHFDLYNEKLIYTTTSSGPKKKITTTTTLSDIDINRFAPFSHDAESCGVSLPCASPVPEPGTMLLLGSGIALAFFARFRTATALL
jgi:hypothetical protein